MSYKSGLLISLTLIAGMASAIPWPVGIGGPDSDQTYAIMGTYGKLNNDWDEIQPTPSNNFHTGVDIAASDIQSENVWCVQDGVFTDCHQVVNAMTGQSEWCAVISSEGLGWCYIHVQGDDGFPVALRNVQPRSTIAFLGDLLGTMAEISPKHLHFARTGPTAPPGYGGIDNPLDFLEPCAIGANDFVWLLDSPNKSNFFLRDYPAFSSGSEQSWENLWTDPASVLEDSIPRDALNGKVDLFLSIVAHGDGLVGTPTEPSMIQRVSCALSQYETEQGWVGLWNHSLVDFDGSLGWGMTPPSSDWAECKRLYFKYLSQDLVGGGPFAYTLCLTNYDDTDTEIFSGISRITENSWNTCEAADGSGDSYHPLNLVTPDGPYRIDITASAWDLDVTLPVQIDCFVSNTREIAEQVTITDMSESGMKLWNAEWVDFEGPGGFEPELYVISSNPAVLGHTIQVEITFSGPMDTNSEPIVEFTKPGGPSFVVEPMPDDPWSAYAVPDPYSDRWTGYVQISEEDEVSGWLTLEIQAQDISGLGLFDPSDPNPGPPSGDEYEEYIDAHHGVMIDIGEEQWQGDIWTAPLLHYFVDGSPSLGDLDGNGDLDIAYQDRDGWVEILQNDGYNPSPWPEWNGWPPEPEPTDIILAPRLSPALADLDEDGQLEVINAHRSGATARDVSGAAMLPNWPIVMMTEDEQQEIWGFDLYSASPAIGELNLDGLLEVVLCRVMADFQMEETNTVYSFSRNGGEPLWSRDLGTPTEPGASVLATPAVGDVNSDGNTEVIVATAPGYTYPLGAPTQEKGRVFALNGCTGSTLWQYPIEESPAIGACLLHPPVVADLDLDGTYEVVVDCIVSGVGKIYILNGADGTLERLISCPDALVAPPGLGDLNGDGYPDIVACSPEMIYAWSGQDGEPLTGFPCLIAPDDYQTGSPSLVDFDSDGSLEIVIASTMGYLYAFNHDGTPVVGFPKKLPCYYLENAGVAGQVAIGEFDQDGSLEFVMASCIESLLAIWCYDIGAGSIPMEMPWVEYQHDSWHSGFLDRNITVPEPPTGLYYELEWTMYSCRVTLHWTPSESDPGSSGPGSPKDVVGYRIYRAWGPSSFQLVGEVPCGEQTFAESHRSPYPDPKVRYYVMAYDGQNLSEPSNQIAIRLNGSNNLARGCRVTEVLVPGMDAPAGSLSSPLRPSASIESVGPFALTDGDTSTVYRPAAGVRSVVIDLRTVCKIGSVSFAQMESLVEPVQSSESPISAEVSEDGESWRSLTSLGDESTINARYVRISPAPETAEIYVWGSYLEDDESMPIISLSRADGIWCMTAQMPPEAEAASFGASGTFTVYDLAGRLVRSWSARPGETILWDTTNRQGESVPSGCYLLLFEGEGVHAQRMLLVF